MNDEPLAVTLHRNLEHLTPLGFTVWKHLVLNPSVAARPDLFTAPPAHPAARHGSECICWECVQGRMLEEW